MYPRSFGTLALSLALLCLAACEKVPPKPLEMPSPEVAVVAAHAQSVPITRDLVGRLAATRSPRCGRGWRGSSWSGSTRRAPT